MNQSVEELKEKETELFKQLEALSVDLDKARLDINAAAQEAVNEAAAPGIEMIRKGFRILHMKAEEDKSRMTVPVQQVDAEKNTITFQLQNQLWHPTSKISITETVRRAVEKERQLAAEAVKLNKAVAKIKMEIRNALLQTNNA